MIVITRDRYTVCPGVIDDEYGLVPGDLTVTNSTVTILDSYNT